MTVSHTCSEVCTLHYSCSYLHILDQIMLFRSLSNSWGTIINYSLFWYPLRIFQMPLAYLKDFSSVVLFTRVIDIPVSKLTHLWFDLGFIKNSSTHLSWPPYNLFQPRHHHNTERSIPVCISSLCMQHFVQLSDNTIHILTAMLWYEGEDCLYISCLQQGNKQKCTACQQVFNIFLEDVQV